MGLVNLTSSYHVDVHVYFPECLKVLIGYLIWADYGWELCLCVGSGASVTSSYIQDPYLYLCTMGRCVVSLFTDISKIVSIQTFLGMQGELTEACNAFPSLSLKCTHRAPISILKLLYCSAHLCIKVMNS